MTVESMSASFSVFGSWVRTFEPIGSLSPLRKRSMMRDLIWSLFSCELNAFRASVVRELWNSSTDSLDNCDR